MIVTQNGNANEKTLELNHDDIESAVRQFICSCYPELSIAHVIDVKLFVGGNGFSATATAKLQE